MRRALLFAVLGLGLAGATPTAFRGCGDDRVETPLPPADPSVCVDDSDCGALDACAVNRCLAGVCTLVANFRDADGDGVAPAPCGADCDDGDRLVSPNALEQCNGFDDDCDGLIDDDAPWTETRITIDARDVNSVIGWLGDGLIIVGSGTVRTLDRYGRLGAPIDVFGSDRTFSRLAVASDADGRALIAAVDAAETTISLAIVTPGPTPSVLALTDLVSEAPVLDLALVAHGASFAIAWSRYSPERARFEIALSRDVRSSDAPLLIRTQSESVALASDGSALAIAQAVPEVLFVDPDGTVTSSAVEGNVARHGLASGDGFVVALTVPVVAGGTRVSATRVTRSGADEPLTVLNISALVPSDDTRIERTGGRYVAAHLERGALTVAVFDVAARMFAFEGTRVAPSTATLSVAAGAGLAGLAMLAPRSAEVLLLADCAAP